MKDNSSRSVMAACRHLLLLCLTLLLATGCSETHVFHIQTGADGTKIEAKQVVSAVYSQAPDTEIDQLLYSGGDLVRAVKRIRDRYPLLKPWLDQGIIGNTASGFVALRDQQSAPELRDLLRAENSDRAFLHTQVSVAVGHGTGYDLSTWLPYASYSFGSEWIAQGQSGWWHLGEEKDWKQK